MNDRVVVEAEEHRSAAGHTASNMDGQPALPGGGDSVLRQLIEDHADAVYRYLRRRVASPTDADEVLGDVFVKAWRAWASAPQPGPHQRAWLFTIARHAAIDHFRRSRRHARLLTRLRAVRGELWDPGPPGPPDPAIARALAALRDPDRELLRLVAWEQLSHAEIAQVLGCREGTVAVRLHRARDRLREQLRAEGAASEVVADRPLSDRGHGGDAS